MGIEEIKYLKINTIKINTIKTMMWNVSPLIAKKNIVTKKKISSLRDNKTQTVCGTKVIIGLTSI